ncbi:acetyl-CoA carboxylase, biotin carboxylase subunit [Desulfotomaculum arcticum]|uniref:biotin carboxylase n=1 Tax=Desulfotruncus arcticus DSM 17038 TaxID=1121424 RepID=A0A1I2NCS1_9FIRM|nr:biotin carboxylase N-terminal domain-containing protein [Desulfotruncus arcticus]SFG01542.1 acetyl-CoA carboxylase, biotin carboxylase subunit [Desulfotomaculum arcticum] [Desulfotruncus arcticus DSM 17038]
MVKKLLIANRGEIVPRIIRACRKLGIKTVAVYSEADKNAFYLQQADEAYLIGPANPVKSYLNIDVIIDTAKKSGADAVHPGYGFLSENAAFAEAVAAGGMNWIGPLPAVLKAIESKCYCRDLATKAGVPVVPGTVKPLQDADEIRRFGYQFGFPLILKLDKGGGGKGIEIIRGQGQGQVKQAYERLSRIGQLAFASSDCYVEIKVEKPRHIEIQFLADRHGNVVCLGERECSIQRRYQKIIEESPSPVVTEEDRENLYQYTKSLVQAMNYQGAGTMEFLRADDGKYYFMEINARLQVEHPVTEFVTGLDIVQCQLAIASGEQLKVRQSDIQLSGHAVEARVYAEDPVTFFPSPGSIAKLHFPPMDDGRLRIDHALEEGGVVPPYYDPLLAKVIAWGSNRSESIQRLKDALSEFVIAGVKTTVPANLAIISSASYLAGTFNTSFIEEMHQ